VKARMVQRRPRVVKRQGASIHDKTNTASGRYGSALDGRRFPAIQPLFSARKTHVHRGAVRTTRVWERPQAAWFSDRVPKM